MTLPVCSWMTVSYPSPLLAWGTINLITLISLYSTLGMQISLNNALLNFMYYVTYKWFHGSFITVYVLLQYSRHGNKSVILWDSFFGWYAYFFSLHCFIMLSDKHDVINSVEILCFVSFATTSSIVVSFPPLSIVRQNC